MKPLTMTEKQEWMDRIEYVVEDSGYVRHTSSSHPELLAYAAKRAHDEIDALRLRVEELERAVRWALGEGESFPEYPGPLVTASGMTLHRYWYWRSELRQRAALDAAPARPELASLLGITQEEGK